MRVSLTKREIGTLRAAILSATNNEWAFVDANTPSRQEMSGELWAMWDFRGITELAYLPGDFSEAAEAIAYLHDDRLSHGHN